MRLNLFDDAVSVRIVTGEMKTSSFSGFSGTRAMKIREIKKKKPWP